MSNISANDFYSHFKDFNVFEEAGIRFFIVDQNVNVIYMNGKEIRGDKRQFPGDYFKCVNAREADHGCGTHENCKFCNLRNAISNTLISKEKQQTDVSLLMEDNKEKDFHMRTKILELNGKEYVACLLIDVTAKQREMMMERVFFHDMLNLSGTLNGFLQCLDHESVEDVKDVVQQLSEQIISELKMHRDLIYAEKGILQLHMEKGTAEEILTFAYQSLRVLVEELGATLVCEDNVKDILLVTDANVVHRVLLNMVKNASEANQGGSITLKAYQEGDNVVFSVHNDTVIPQDIRPNIFKLGNTSKGSGRGTGTYSIKLLGENYLHGKVRFKSEEGKGTTFTLALPIWK